MSNNLPAQITLNGVNYVMASDYPAEVEEQIGKPKQIFYPNGAVVYPLEKGDSYYIICLDIICLNYTSYQLREWEGSFIDLCYLESGNVFLTQESAEKWLNILKIKSKLKKRVIEINAKNNWVCDWSNRNQGKYGIRYNTIEHKYLLWEDFLLQTSTFYMCEEAAEWLLSDEVTDEERDAWIHP